MDTENSGLRIYDADFENAGISFAVDPYRAWYVPLGHKKGKQLDRQKTLKLLNHVLKGKKYVFHNASYDRRTLKKYGIDLPIENMVLDTVLAFYALDERWSRVLKEYTNHDSCHWRMLGYASPSYRERFKYRGKQNRILVQNAADIDTEVMSEYASNDARITQIAYYWTRHRLNQDKKTATLVHLENRFSDCVSEMEDTGYLLDKEILQKIGHDLREDLDRLTEKMRKLTGIEDFEPKNRGHVRKYLYKRLNLSTVTNTNSTTKDIIDGLAGKLKDTKVYSGKDEDGITYQATGAEIKEFVLTFQEFAKKDKLESTYTGNLLTKVAADGRIHTSYNQVGTDTGRSSSNDPNMQQLPKLEPGYEKFDIRKAFKAPEGYRILLADHEGQEMVVMAIASGCPVLGGIVTGRHKIQVSKDRLEQAIQDGDTLWVPKLPKKIKIEDKKAGNKRLARIAWCQDEEAWTPVSGKALSTSNPDQVFDKIDIHKFTAFQTPGIECPYWEVTKENRQNSKMTNFGIIFGQEAYGLSKRLNISEDLAKSFIQGFKGALTGVAKWMQDTINFAKRHHYTETLFGRRRHSGKRQMAANMGREVRMLQNHPIQGSAADVFKKCVIKLQDALDEKFPDRKLTGSILLLGQIHDEIHVLCREDLIPEAIELIEEAMSFTHRGIKLHAGVDVKKTLSKLEEPEKGWGKK